MTKEMRDICLFIGTIGLGYAMVLLALMLFTGVKIFKTVVIIVTLSSMLFTMGLSPVVRKRLKEQALSVLNR